MIYLKNLLKRVRCFTGRELSYKELDRLAKNLENYKQKRVDYDEARAINNEALKNGLPQVYTHKRWIWSELENTRHSNMDGVIVDFYDLFTVRNEVNGDVDGLLFPGDVENYVNPSNVINCGCDVEYINKDDNVKEIGEYNAKVVKVIIRIV